MSPTDAPSLLQKARGLQALGMTAQALAISRALDPKDLADAQHCLELGNLLRLQQQYRAALNAYDQALAHEPRNAALHFNKAVIQRYLGDFTGAQRSCDVTLRLDPCDYETQLLRSGLRKQTSASNHIAELQTLLGREQLRYLGRAQVHYALAKEYEDLGEDELAFEHVEQGADLRRRHMRYDVGADEEAISRIIERFDETALRSGGPGAGSSEPIFIIGLPRTGTTLVERVLGSHSQVYAAGELGNFAQQMMRLIKESAVGAPLDKLSSIDRSLRLDFERLGLAYVESVRPLTGGAARFTDKLPLNFLYVGLIALAIPKAKIIHVVRDPMDTCYSMYKHHFKDAYPFSYSLDDLGRYFIAYSRLMRHWKRVLPGRIHEIAYEDLVGDFEPQCRGLLEYCELPWETECLHFHQSAAPSTTASAEQVRQPIYTESVGRWKRVSSRLQELETKLRDAGLLPGQSPD